MHTRSSTVISNWFTFVLASAVALLMSAPAPADASQPRLAVARSTMVFASYVSVCRDQHGTLDRRACRHSGRRDPQRVTVAQR